ncbi:MAG: YdcF family protein [Planctomycetaceae bacterium]|nr:YdcF family protein [Planctomycetaceae bacterium]
MISLLAVAELSVQPKPAGAPAIAVLFGDADRMGATTLRSLRNARTTASPQAIFIGIGGARPDIGYSGACEMRDWLVARGIDRSRISVDTRSFDTKSNLVELRRFASELATAGPIVIVTDSLHALRIRVLFGGGLDPGLLVPGYRLIDGTLASTVNALSRSQYELVAWVTYLALPDSAYQALLKRLRRNTHESGTVLNCR